MNLNEDTFSNLRDKVADIKYDTQQVLDRIDSIDAAYQERTGLEQSLEREVTVQRAQVSAWKKEVDKLKLELQRQQDLGQGYYDSMMTFKQQLDEAKTNMALMTDESTSDSVTIKQLYNQVDKLKSKGALLEERIDEMKSAAFADCNTIKHLKEEREMLEKNVKYLRDENERLKREKEASSGPCGCQAYRDLESKLDNARLDKVCAPTNPVIPKDVAIAIFREGVAHGVSSACDELDNSNDIEINETGYTGGFEVNFTKYIDLSEYLDLDWMRDKVGDYSEESVLEALKDLCADKDFECRIHGIDDQETNK